MLLAEGFSNFPALALPVAPLVVYVSSIGLTGTSSVAGLTALFPRQAGKVENLLRSS